MVSASKRFRNAISRSAGAPGEEDEAYRRAAEFDPTAAVATTARAGFDTFREDLAREIEALRGRSVGMGRLNTGFGWEDEGDVVRTLGDRLNREVAGAAVQTTGMDMSNRHATLGAAQNRTGRYYDMLAADRDYETAEENRRREKKSSLASGLSTLLGAGAGALIAGPGGRTAGAKLGGAIGGAAGKLFG